MFLSGMTLAALLDLDRSLFVQLALFLFTVVALNYLVFKPLFRVLEMRRERTEGMKEKAAAHKARAVGLQAEYEQVYAQVVDQGAELRKSARVEGQKAEHGVLEAARARAEQERGAAEAARAAEEAQVKSALEAEVQSLRELVARKVGQ
jgi:F-type H+-transporting ATPase subunit b